jgi:ubiquinone/menaquinone biosynthesis C-methylase UbiE
MTWTNYWKERSAGYIKGLDGPYHANRLAMVRALLATTPFARTRCLDFGCGDGAFAEYLLESGAIVDGIDIDSTMIDAARQRLTARWPATKLGQGGVEALAQVPTATVDHLLALNVLAYLGRDEEAAFYREAGRVVKDGGTLTVTHSNELFDLYTFNRYTVDFFRKHFSFDNTACDITSLLVYPDKPDRRVFSVRENPLAYRFKLQRFGFREIRQEFAILHSLPPLLTPEINFDDINSRQYPNTIDWPEAERWKLMFACSIFGSHSIKEG